MFKKEQRLQGKEVRFLTRKRQIFNYGLLNIFYIQQYPNRHYHQFSYHIPLLVSKRAVVRHKVKRILIADLEKILPSLDFGGKYYKGFISLHKGKLQELLAILEKKDSTQLKVYLETENKKAFTSFAQLLGKKH